MSEKQIVWINTFTWKVTPFFQVHMYQIFGETNSIHNLPRGKRKTADSTVSPETKPHAIIPKGNILHRHHGEYPKLLDSIFLVAPCISLSRLISTPTNAHT